MQNLEIPREAEEVVEAAQQELVLAQTFVVDCAEEYMQAGKRLKEIKSRVRQIDDLRKSMTRPMDEAKSRIMEFFRPATEQLTKAAKLVESAMLQWQQEEERKRLEEERRLQALARKEQERLQKLAEERAQRWEERGRLEKAEEIRESVPVIPVPVVARETPVVKGVSVRTIWKFRVVRLADVPREWLILDEKKMGEFARATKGSIPVPGIEFYSEQILPTRS